MDNNNLDIKIFRKLKAYDATGSKIKRWNQLTFRWICENKYFGLLRYWVDAHYDLVEELNQSVMLRMPLTLETYDERLDENVVLFRHCSITTFMENNRDLGLFLFIYFRFQNHFELAREPVNSRYEVSFNVLESACLAGNLDIVETLIRNKFKINNKQEALVKTGRSGNMKLLERIAKLCAPIDISVIKDMIRENRRKNVIPIDMILYLLRNPQYFKTLFSVDGHLLYHIVQFNHLDLLKFLIEELNLDITSSQTAQTLNATFDYSANAGIDMFNYVLELLTKAKWTLVISSLGFSGLIALYKQIDDELFFQLYSTIPKSEYVIRTAQSIAVSKSHIDLLKKLVDLEGIPALTSPIIISAFKVGNIDIIRTVLSIYGNHVGIEREERDKLILEMVKAGNLELLQLIITIGIDPPPIGTSVMTEAARLGQLEIVKYIRKNRVEGCEPHTLAWCIANGSSQEMIDFLLDECMPFFSVKSLEPIKNACGRGDILLVQKLLSFGFAIDHEALEIAAANNHLDIVKSLDMYAGSQTAMNLAAENGHLETVIYLHNHRKEGCNHLAMDRALQNGCMDVVRFLHDNRTEGCTPTGIDKSLSYGQTAAIKFVVENRSERWTHNGLHSAVLNGHFKLARYAMSILNNLSQQSINSFLKYETKDFNYRAIQFYYYIGLIKIDDIKEVIVSKDDIDAKLFLLGLINPKTKYSRYDNVRRDSQLNAQVTLQQFLKNVQR
ncbi:hypothetical protein PPL_02768 [Heterostelium album PN500]|uniref:Ankyrin repeat protein n=1 Tax=Heterostelium pallidum (strain ATCC 26659 / Pp 5 / PN500) TaxID=670386 RepID=D3B303_HETP5|nr:hypothetical protein PPL_02768 [Heterostelium album PN500]EFA83701.1 hypothetical protein PPL_02768 [Heterostelium album PN500]|eukprot:XP_020435818.1 hypothetical protein PPL_02768 [Heterostelium album PN500]